MVEIRNLTKTYGKYRALNNLNLHIDKGEIFGFVGPNGAGKTTTMRIICGLLQADWGEVYVDAKKIKLGQNTFSTVKKDNWTGGKKPQDYMQADNARYAVFARSDYAEYTDLASRDFVNTLNELNKMTEGKKDFDKEVLAVGLKLRKEVV